MALPQRIIYGRLTGRLRFDKLEVRGWVNFFCIVKMYGNIGTLTKAFVFSMWERIYPRIGWRGGRVGVAAIG